MIPAEPFFKIKCHRCGVEDEAKFELGSVHLKQVCNGCESYIKFFDKSIVPSITDIKLKIWYMTEQDLDIINTAKKEIEFVYNLQGLIGKIMYWKLYLKLREKIKI